MNSLYMQKLAQLENQYNIDKQAVLDAKREIEAAENMAAKWGGARATVSVCMGSVSVWVQGSHELANIAELHGELTKMQVGNKFCYLYKGVKVLEW